MRKEPSASIAYIPSFDGLRALAVVAVVGFHYWPDIFIGGFVGVDIFFALSGYLITSILMAENDATGRVDLGAFWGRRIRRLVPAVLLLVSVCAVWMVLIQTASYRAFVDSIGALSWTTNWLELGFSDAHFFARNRSTVLDHLWSLAIEEQFYIVWPVMFLGLSKYVRQRSSQLLVVGALIVASVVAMGLSGTFVGYFGTHTRAFELLAGALLAMSRFVPTARLGRIFLAVGLVGLAVIIAFAEAGETYMYPFGFVGVSLVSMSLVMALISPIGRWKVAFEIPLVRRVGAMSYGIYLWHIPIYRFLSEGRTGLSSFWLMALRFAVLAAVVSASYNFLEHPIRTRRLRPSAMASVAAVIVVIGSVTALGISAHDDYGTRFETSAQMPESEGKIRVLVLGDILGAVFADGLELEDEFAVWDVTEVACPLIDAGLRRDGDLEFPSDFCNEWELRWRAAIEDFEPDAIVVSAGYWDLGPRYKSGVDDDSSSSELRAAAFSDEELLNAYEEAAQRANGIVESAGVPVVWVGIPDLESLAPRNDAGPDVAANSTLWNEVFRAAFENTSGKSPEMNVIDLPAGSARAEGLEFSSEIAELITQQLG